MEVLSCSGARRVGESDCPDQESEAASKHDGVSEHVRTDLKIDDLTLNVGESHEVREDGSQVTLEGFLSEGGCNGETYYKFDFDGQTLSSYSHDSEDESLENMDHFAEPCLTLEDPHLVMDTVESGLPPPYSEIKGLDQDEPQAVWVKWRGNWQSGIKCARADWPLSTLKAKPTHDRKQYIVIFFPSTRNYSWADVLLIRPINELPNPVAYKTHNIGMKMVKDLTVARRFIMQKLAVSMLNILEQLNREALVETARDVMVLKNFAMEASRCKDYSDLGRMLLKLQNMIQHRCLSSDWLHQFMQSWKQRCQDANSAQCIEMLKEELSNAILWNEMATPVAKKHSSTPTTPNTVRCFFFSNQVLLHNWWLIRADSGSHGKQLGIGGFTFSFKDGQEIRCFCSAPIIERHDAVTLRTADGITIMVHGYLNKSRTLENGFSHEVCDHFLIGFPYYWEEFSAQSDGEEGANLSDSKGVSVPSEEASSGNPSKLSVKRNRIRKRKEMRDVDHSGPLTRSRARKTRTGLMYGNEIRHC